MIFQSELTNLDSEFSRLQAQLAVLQQRRNLYSQLQQQTEGYLVGLAKLKEQIAETVGGSAIAFSRFSRCAWIKPRHYFTDPRQKLLSSQKDNIVQMALYRHFTGGGNLVVTFWM